MESELANLHSALQVAHLEKREAIANFQITLNEFTAWSEIMEDQLFAKFEELRKQFEFLNADRLALQDRLSVLAPLEDELLADAGDPTGVLLSSDEFIDFKAQLHKTSNEMWSSLKSSFQEWSQFPV